jgi:hypothetical protein
VALHERDEVPACPSCGGDQFRRATLFGESESAAAPVAESNAEGWLEAARDALIADGDYLAFDTGERVQVIPLQDGWTRVGRSLAAHVRLDDPTVSRRHALLYRDEEGAKVLDDRSLNGVFHNGERVELSELEDGDTVAVGRFTLHFISLDGEGEGTQTTGPTEGALA